MCKLKEKALALGRSPTKNEINADSNMPNASAYLRFGGLIKALGIINQPTGRVCDLSLDKYIECAQKYFNDFNKVPTVSDFDNTEGYPHSSYIRKILKMSWNQFLEKAGLPYMTNGDMWAKNHKAELIVKAKLKNEGYIFEFLSENNSNAPFAFVINDGTTIDVRYSSPILDHGQYFWKFKLHLKDKKRKPDYFYCLGFDKASNFEGLFIVPTNDLREIQQVISVNIQNMRSSKYYKYYCKQTRNRL